MTCPVCKQIGARRSRRHAIADYALSMLGVYPWRCRSCHTRFHARLMPLSESFHTHCPICGNLELKRISSEHVHSPLGFLWRVLHVPAFRCEPCRYKYFSVLPMRELQPEDKAVHVSSAD
jgi:C4-type Zn-finger protein